MVMIFTMRELNVSGVDLNLIPSLLALLRRRNVTRAADDVGLSQPAMSRALGRLREVLDDPLLVRTRSGYVLTPRAEAIAPQVEALIAQVRGVFQPQAFDPAAQQRVLRLAATDTHTVLVIPSVAERLAREAPGVDLRVTAYGADPFGRLERGDLDFAFALASSPLPPGVHSEVVYTDHLALVMRRRHPAAGRPWILTDYGAYAHVGVALTGDGQSEIDAILAAAGVSRRIALVTPHFTAALAAVAASDMVTTVSAALARTFAGAFDLVLQPPPFGETALPATLVCSHVRAADPFLIWFRQLVREVAADRIGRGLNAAPSSR
jgi:DNA-binding transcriptional LysR family regulator